MFSLTSHIKQNINNGEIKSSFSIQTGNTIVFGTAYVVDDQKQITIRVSKDFQEYNDYDGEILTIDDIIEKHKN